MSKITSETILEQLNWRYAVKTFDATKKVSAEDFEVLEKALILAPSSYGFQPYKFVIVTDDATKESLKPHAWNQSQITDCSHLVVFAAKNDLTAEDVTKLIDRIAEVREMPREQLKDYETMLSGFQQKAAAEGWAGIWTAKQCYIALGFLLETAAMLEIDACPMEGFMPEGFTRVLGLDKEGYTATVICAVGYRDAKNDWLANLAKVRYPESDLIKRV